jgi:hypothetical protein
VILSELSFRQHSQPCGRIYGPGWISEWTAESKESSVKFGCIRNIALSSALCTALVPNVATATTSKIVVIRSHPELGGKCLDVPNSQFLRGIRVQMWDCNDNGGQVFSYDQTNQELTIGGLCVESWGRGDSPDAVGLGACNGNVNQRWRMVADGGYYQIIGVKRLCLELRAAAREAGAPLDIQDCDAGKPWRLWTVVDANPETPLVDRLGTIWNEAESDWTGKWTRRPGTNQFDAEWTRAGQQKITAVLSVSIQNNVVTVQRMQTHCLMSYHGTIAGSKVTGTFAPCGGDARPWTATIIDARTEAPVGPAAPGRNFKSPAEENVDLVGTAYYQFNPPEPNPDLCRSACTADAECRAWTYVRPNTVLGPSPQCSLKNVAYSPKSAAYAVSGVVRPGALDSATAPSPNVQDASHGCEVVVYWDRDFKGEAWRSTDNQTFVGAHWNDQISSIKVVKGTWDFHDSADYGPGILRLGVGSYPFLGDDWNDRISSFRCIASSP